jgi:outer membrane immunogenic protein
MKRIVSIVALSIVALSFVDGSAAFGRMIANTADEPPPSPPPPPAPAAPSPYSWSGLYIGGNLGAGFSAGTYSDVFGAIFATPTNTTFVGGGQAGVNYEFPSGILIGAEAMFDWLPTQNNNIGAVLGGALAGAAVHDRWVTTATGRLGHAWDRILVYAKGGGAWVGTSNSTLSVSTGAPLALSAPSTNWGWTAGLGFECALWPNWSARVEYDYVGLKKQTFTVGSGTAPFATDIMSTKNLNLNLITAGVNYKFGLW